MNAALGHKLFQDIPRRVAKSRENRYIYDRPVTGINVIASVCALNLRIKI